MKMKENFKPRRIVIQSIWLIFCCIFYFGESTTNQRQFERCCNNTGVNATCQNYCNSYLTKMKNTDACIHSFNRILKCNDGKTNRRRCCNRTLGAVSSDCVDLCLNYDKWILNFSSSCDEDRQRILLCFIEIAIPDVPPTITRISPKNPILKSNEKLKLECEAKGKPEVTYEWKKDGFNLNLCNQTNYNYNCSNGTITFHRLRDDDEGDYQCYARNQHGTAVSDVIRLRKSSAVNANGAAPKFAKITDGPYNVIVSEGCSTTFRCNASGTPVPRIVWLMNGVVINEPKLPERFELSDNGKNLTIRDVCRVCKDRENGSDLMVIQCNASNAHGYAFASGYLNVLRRTSVTIGSAANVLVDSRNETDLHFCCRANSDQVVSLGTKLTWYFKQNGRYTDVREWNGNSSESGIVVSDTTLMVRIGANDTAVWGRNQGEYVCVGEYKYSQDEKSIIISANAQVKLDLRRIIIGRDEVQFFCSFCHKRFLSPVVVRQFRWYLNDEEISNPVKLIITTEKTFNSSNCMNSNLKFESVQPQNSGGRVRCLLEYNSQGDFSLSRDDYLPFKPTVSMYPLSVTVNKSTGVNLNCTVTNFNQSNEKTVNFTWYKDSQLESSSEQHSPIFIKNWTVSETAVIGCTATIGHGTSVRQNATITVLKKKDKFCLKNISSVQKITWPVTKTGNIAQHPCPEEATGICYRTCSITQTGDPVWLEPDCSKCVSKKLTKILDKIDDLENGIGSNKSNVVADVVIKLSEFTNGTTSRNQGNLEASIKAVASLAKLRNSNREAVPAKEEINSAVRIINNLLQPTNDSSWNAVKQENEAAAAPLMSFGETYGRGLAQTINRTENSTVRVVTDLVVLEAKSLQVNSFPQTFTFSSPDVWMENRTDQISIIMNEQDLGGGTNSSLDLWNLFYKNLEDYLPGDKDFDLNSRVLSLSVAQIPTGQRLSQPVTVVLEHNKMAEAKFIRRCVFWKFYPTGSGGHWSDDGCTVQMNQSDENKTACRCNHLTNFAVLLSRSPASDFALSLISLIGCSISVVALIITIVIYAVTWKQVKSHQVALLINLCVALIIANVIFLAGAGKDSFSVVGCKAVAALLHYFFLVALFLMLAEGLQLIVYVVFVFHAKRKSETKALIVAAWVLPLIIIAVTLGVTKTSGYENDKACWLSSKDGAHWAFMGPAIAIIAVNAVIIVVVFRRIFAARIASTKNENNDKIRRMAWNLAVLCPVLGIAWLFGVLSIAFESVVFQYIFAIANSFQGLFIFLFHGLYNNKKSNEKISSFVSQLLHRGQDDKKRRKPKGKSSKKSPKYKEIGLETTSGLEQEQLIPTSFGDTVGKETVSSDLMTSSTVMTSEKSNSQMDSFVTSSVTAEVYKPDDGNNIITTKF